MYSICIVLKTKYYTIYYPYMYTNTVLPPQYLYVQYYPQYCTTLCVCSRHPNLLYQLVLPCVYVQYFRLSTIQYNMHVYTVLCPQYCTTPCACIYNTISKYCTILCALSTHPLIYSTILYYLVYRCKSNPQFWFTICNTLPIVIKTSLQLFSSSLHCRLVHLEHFSTSLGPS